MENNDKKLDKLTQIGANQLTAEQKAGMQLARTLLWMIAGVIIFYALICMEHGCSQGRAPALSDADALFHDKSATAPYSGCITAPTISGQLDFAFRNLQYVMNVLLPVFTTVLGYIFGTRSRG